MGEQMVDGYCYGSKKSKTGGRKKGSKNRPKPEGYVRDPPHGNTGFCPPGNRTRGAERRGNRSGRPPLYPKGTPVSQLALWLSDNDRAIATYLGEGKVSQGIRRALAMAAVQIDCPESLEKAIEVCRTSRIGVNELLRRELKDFEIEVPKISKSGAGRVRSLWVGRGRPAAVRDPAEVKRIEEIGARVFRECAEEDRKRIELGWMDDVTDTKESEK